MKFPYSNSARQKENVIPLINIVFLLLIFFMVATHVEQYGSIIAPKSNSSLSEKVNSQIITVNNAGQISWNDKTYSLDNLMSGLVIEDLSSTKQQIFIKIDESRDANEFLYILDALRANNIQKVKLITRQDTGS